MGIDPSRSNPRCRRRWFQSNISHRTVPERMARAPRYSNRLAGGILGAVAMACNKRQHFVLVEVIISEKTNWNCSYGRNINYKKLIRVLEIESHRLTYYFLLSYPKKKSYQGIFLRNILLICNIPRISEYNPTPIDCNTISLNQRWCTIITLPKYISG